MVERSVIKRAGCIEPGLVQLLLIGPAAASCSSGGITTICRPVVADNRTACGVLTLLQLLESRTHVLQADFQIGHGILGILFVFQ